MTRLERRATTAALLIAALILAAALIPRALDLRADLFEDGSLALRACLPWGLCALP
jgi:hypothetical protein